MPLGIERLNVRKQQPNSRIVFIKPLEGPHKAHAQDFLERIAAICHPIMKAHHLAVMSLEEYEPNREFVGRNFNAGEVIQLVLRAPYSGHWLPFRHVQMVMMHELAHCKEMNHGRGFWAVRDGYAAELRALWAKDYTGDGFWSRGQPLLSSEYTTTSLAADDPTPDSLCGGIYRTASSGRKRKRGKPKNVAAARPALTYAERQQRRIARKFGTNGVALGEDQTARVAWHKGKKVKGKPRVAGSARGRELRAAAALARFQPVETDVKGQGEEENDEFDDDDENDSDEYGEGEGEEGMTEKGTKGREDARDLDGSKMVDRSGRGMVKVCEDENEDGEEGEEVKRERRELQEVDGLPSSVAASPSNPTSTSASTLTSYVKREERKAEEEAVTCPICTLTLSTNSGNQSTTCPACSHVLKPESDPGCWRCESDVCAVVGRVSGVARASGSGDGITGGESDSGYLNAADSGVCGVCGVPRSTLVGTNLRTAL